MRTAVRIAAGLAKFTAGLALALAIFLTGVYFQLRGALPAYSGQIEATGLRASVEIVRDRNAVPHIVAGSIEDAAFGLGYAHAQDRFWQMELMRRLGQGRLSELIPPKLVGQAMLDVDRTMRGLGVYRHASNSLGSLSPGTRAVLDAYAAGVNAWLGDKSRLFGLELTIVELLSGGTYQPERWQPADSLVWTKLMALSLDGNWRSELMRLRLLKKLGEDGVNFLIEPRGDSRDATLPIVKAALDGIDLDRLFRATDSVATRKREASNEWVLSGAHTVSGKPLLANDPHLGLSFPGTWYLARLVGPGFDIRGASPPGVPTIALGHNGRIGWGFTTTNLDSQDLFVERVDPTDPNRYITPDGARPFRTYDETIKVAWGEPVQIRARETRHGVIISDFVTRATDLTPQGHVLALQATALDSADTTIEGLIRLGMAQNWDEFLAATRKVVTPMQNVVYADTTGNIGLVAPARVPIRRSGDGSMPKPGWTSDFDWAGNIPFDELPRVYNPVNGIIVNANGRLVPDGYRHFISRDWAAPYRQRRAGELLHEVDRHPVYGMIAIQADNLAADAGELLPLLMAGKPRNPRATKAYELLGPWTRFMLANRPEPLIYEAWLMEVQRGLLAGRFGPELYRDVPSIDVELIARILRTRRQWCDDPTTPAAESCDDVIAAALDRALDGVATRQGTQIENWQWGREHQMSYRHPLFDRVPLLRELASVRYPGDGGTHTLNRAQAAHAGPRPFEAVHGATYRGIYDFNDLDNSRFALPLGQSGHILSPYARNFVDRWRKLGYVEIAGTRSGLAHTAIGTLVLSPTAR